MDSVRIGPCEAPPVYPCGFGRSVHAARVFSRTHQSTALTFDLRRNAYSENDEIKDLKKSPLGLEILPGHK